MMQENKEKYYTVAEIAKLSGVSNQAVYKRLTTNLSKYVKVVNGKKLVSSRAIELLNQSTVDKHSTKSNPTVDNDSMLSTMNKTIDLLQNQLEVLQNELDVKNKQIEHILNNASQSNFLLAQTQHKALEGNTIDVEGHTDDQDGFNLPWYKKLFRSKRTNRKGIKDNADI